MKCFEENYLPPFSTHEVKDDKKETNTCKDENFDLDVFHISFSGQDNLNAHSTSNILCTKDVVGAARDASLENLDLGSPLEFNLSVS